MLLVCFLGPAPAVRLYTLPCCRESLHSAGAHSAAPAPAAHRCCCPPLLPQSEYPPERYARRAFISNFDGSAGTAVVTSSKAALWTDGRYFLQAGQQLGPDWTLMRQGTPACPEVRAGGAGGGTLRCA